MAFALDLGGCIVMAKYDKNGASREGSGAFAQMAEVAYHLGLCPIPCGGDNGKTPLVTKYNTWKSPPQVSSLARFAAKWPFANLGILARLSKIVVVDIDSANLAISDQIERRFGQTPLRSRTGSGHFHLWYRDPGGQPSFNLRTSEGIPVEIIAGNHIVIVPPSWNSATGGNYIFDRGGWPELAELPAFDASSLDNTVRRKSSTISAISTEGNCEGTRNQLTFIHALKQAKHCDDLAALVDVIETYNDDTNRPPLPENVVNSIINSAWRYQIEDRNFHNAPAMILPTLAFDNLLQVKHGTDAIALLMLLRRMHGANKEPFAIATDAMAKAGTLPGWSEWRIRKAKEALRIFHLIRHHHDGPRKGKKNGPQFFVFADRA